MDKFAKLAKDSIKYYIENKKYLKEYDQSFKDNHNGVLIIIRQNGKNEISGSIYPTRANIGLDIIYESVNATIFNNAIDMTDNDISDLYISVYEVTKIEQIKDMDEFGVYHGLLLKFNNFDYLAFRNDYESDYQMYEDIKDRANVDEDDIYSLYKFKGTRHI